MSNSAPTRPSIEMSRLKLFFAASNHQPSGALTSTVGVCVCAKVKPLDVKLIAKIRKRPLAVVQVCDERAAVRVKINDQLRLPVRKVIVYPHLIVRSSVGTGVPSEKLQISTGARISESSFPTHTCTTLDPQQSGVDIRLPCGQAAGVGPLIFTERQRARRRPVRPPGAVS